MEMYIKDNKGRLFRVDPHACGNGCKLANAKCFSDKPSRNYPCNAMLDFIEKVYRNGYGFRPVERVEST